jgi:DNA-directed RNA polymerase specialized sigma24 family protein
MSSRNATGRSRVTEQYLRDHIADIQNIAVTAALRTSVPRSFFDSIKEDFLQEVTLRVWQYFNEARSSLSNFTHLISERLIREMWGAEMKRSMQTHNELTTDDSDALLVERAGGDEDPNLSILVENAWAASLAHEKMTPNQAEVFAAMVNQTPMAEVRDRMGVSNERTRQLRVRVRDIVQGDLDGMSA